MVVLEFKSAIKENTTIRDAYTQLTVRYRRDIPDLFKYNAFVVISDGVNNKYGSLHAPYDFFYSWRKVNSDDKEQDGINSLHTMMQGLFRPERLLSVIKDFVFLPDSSKKELKSVCRYPQYFATHKLADNIKRHSKLSEGGDGKGGTYFGATGCGKSYTMLFLTKRLMGCALLNNPTIVLLTDRTDLDDQLSEIFTASKKYLVDDNVAKISSRKLLNDTDKGLVKGVSSGGAFLMTVQKFDDDIDLLSDRTNIICISDEAHRTQVNLDAKLDISEDGVKKHYGFAKYLRDSFPNATYVGFTGTPIDATISVFGPVVVSYKMKQAVDDGSTVGIELLPGPSSVRLDEAKIK